MTSSHNVQFNPAIAAWIILSYTFVNKEKDFWAAFFVALGFMAKIYGIVGILVFRFLKTQNKVHVVSLYFGWL